MLQHSLVSHAATLEDVGKSPLGCFVHTEFASGSTVVGSSGGHNWTRAMGLQPQGLDLAELPTSLIEGHYHLRLPMKEALGRS